ncbi:Glycerol-3-phosphate acyltransferase 1 [Morus notabilis]|uniref:Glycerol-3-phosphate acyltransferase 1 n=1 Tax=Morus notabilis TaxID=981085 RepID=W9RQI3_9ROSA|nr:glycerol-3-phosphate acyltransferase 1 [Morus notabilis]EXB92406.1 Glycerol-3-phosphate acyltransferase 1 [Morus notabilis]
MFFPVVLLKLADWVLYQLLANSCYRAARKMRNYGFLLENNSSLRSQQHPPLYPAISKFVLESSRESETLVSDFHGVLLRSHSFFPYFMLVAFEGGGIFRALLLLLSCSFLWLLDYEMKLKVMIFISFCGLKTKDMDNVGRAVLPKFYLENLNLLAYEVFSSAGSRFVFTSLPRVMVEGFLKEYLSVDEVLGTELQTSGKYFTGFVSESGLLVKHRALKEHFGDKKPDIGLGTSSFHDQLLLSLCKEGFIVNVKDQDKSSIIMPREKYPKPLIFHDGRLAFLPTPSSTLAMFLWLPIGIILAIFRISMGFLPFTLGTPLGIYAGVDITVKGPTKYASSSSSDGQKGILFVCNHRTLVDPVFLSISLARSVTAVTYSLSKMSEIIATIRTVRLTRDREQDGATMKRLLSEGDLVVCPEGTTCREPYLLRFSSLFAELSDDIVPVAVTTRVSMFYGTTASGLKWLDPFFFFMNPRPGYSLHFLGKIPKEMTCGGGKTSCEVANYIQKQLADTLGFECTTLTRRDKYLMLAGNEGIVGDNKRRKPYF